MSTSRILKWITGSLEAILGIPILGAVIIISFMWLPLVVMLILHIITLAISIKNNEAYHGSILGIVASVIGWIPFVGLILHILSAVFLMITAASTRNRNQAPIPPHPYEF
ncbi:hypothetical protein [Paenibacillus sp. YIM B09110]|uniref:hypothetical protein n=1 Tax=Paenibacillus sp. YIM B09110 TaxID=3126102 RepID=UPI00301C9F74